MSGHHATQHDVLTSIFICTWDKLPGGSRGRVEGTLLQPGMLNTLWLPSKCTHHRRRTWCSTHMYISVGYRRCPELFSGAVNICTCGQPFEVHIWNKAYLIRGEMILERKHSYRKTIAGRRRFDRKFFVSYESVVRRNAFKVTISNYCLAIRVPSRI